MRAVPNASLIARRLLPAIAVLSLAACGGSQDDDVTYATDVEDQSGGELIVTEEQPDAVPVDVPDTVMTNVPPSEAAEATPSATPTP